MIDYLEWVSKVSAAVQSNQYKELALLLDDNHSGHKIKLKTDKEKQVHIATDLRDACYKDNFAVVTKLVDVLPWLSMATLPEYSESEGYLVDQLIEKEKIISANYLFSKGFGVSKQNNLLERNLDILIKESQESFACSLAKNNKFGVQWMSGKLETIIGYRLWNLLEVFLRKLKDMDKTESDMDFLNNKTAVKLFQIAVSINDSQLLMLLYKYNHFVYPSYFEDIVLSLIQQKNPMTIDVLGAMRATYSLSMRIMNALICSNEISYIEYLISCEDIPTEKLLYVLIFGANDGKPSSDLPDFSREKNAAGMENFIRWRLTLQNFQLFYPVFTVVIKKQGAFDSLSLLRFLVSTDQIDLAEDFVIYLQSQGIDLVALEKSSQDKKSPSLVFNLIHSRHPKAVKFLKTLLIQGFNKNHWDEATKETVIDRAFKLGQLDCALVLMEAGTELDPEKLPNYIVKALMQAHDSAINLLHAAKERGILPDIIAICDKSLDADGSSATHLAAAKGNEDLLKVLIDFGFLMDVNTVLKAADTKHYGCVVALLEKDVNLVLKAGKYKHKYPELCLALGKYFETLKDNNIEQDVRYVKSFLFYLLAGNYDRAEHLAGMSLAMLLNVTLPEPTETWQDIKIANLEKYQTMLFSNYPNSQYPLLADLIEYYILENIFPANYDLYVYTCLDEKDQVLTRAKALTSESYIKYLPASLCLSVARAFYAESQLEQAFKWFYCAATNAESDKSVRKGVLKFIEQRMALENIIEKHLAQAVQIKMTFPKTRVIDENLLNNYTYAVYKDFLLEHRLCSNNAEFALLVFQLDLALEAKQFCLQWLTMFVSNGIRDNSEANVWQKAYSLLVSIADNVENPLSGIASEQLFRFAVRGDRLQKSLGLSSPEWSDFLFQRACSLMSTDEKVVLEYFKNKLEKFDSTPAVILELFFKLSEKYPQLISLFVKELSRIVDILFEKYPSVVFKWLEVADPFRSSFEEKSYLLLGEQELSELVLMMSKQSKVFFSDVFIVTLLNKDLNFSSEFYKNIFEWGYKNGSLDSILSSMVYVKISFSNQKTYKCYRNFSKFLFSLYLENQNLGLIILEKIARAGDPLANLLLAFVMLASNSYDLNFKIPQSIVKLLEVANQQRLQLAGTICKICVGENYDTLWKNYATCFKQDSIVSAIVKVFDKTNYSFFGANYIAEGVKNILNRLPATALDPIMLRLSLVKILLEEYINPQGIFSNPASTGSQASESKGISALAFVLCYICADIYKLKTKLEIAPESGKSNSNTEVVPPPGM